MDTIVRILRSWFRRDDGGQKRKRDPSPCDEDPQKRRRLDQAQQQEEMAAFLRVLEDAYHWIYLACDSCMMTSDKYLLAMVLVYFRRAGLRTEEYRKNFFPALFLANQMEEDHFFRWEIYPWALGKNWSENEEQLHKERDRLLLRLGFRTWVERSTCDEVMAEAPSHWAWTRERLDHHGCALPTSSKQLEDFTIHGPLVSRPTCSLCTTFHLRSTRRAEEDPNTDGNR